MNLINKILSNVGLRLSCLNNVPLSIWENPWVAKKRLIGDDASIVFDVGSNTGQMIDQYLKLFPRAKIYGFEPLPECMNVLREKYHRNTRVSLHQLALGREDSERDFHSNSLDQTSSLLNFDEQAKTQWANHEFEVKDKIKVKGCRLDTFLKNQDIKRINLLKIDIQGAEYELFEGAQEAFRQSLIDLVYFEVILCQTYVGQKKLSNYFDFFESHSYEFIGFYDIYRNEKGSIRQMDLMFSRKK